jgi:low molecular weight protein-tyrosine phosphatase
MGEFALKCADVKWLGREIMVHILFVCMGNICRSPTAEGAFQALIDGGGLKGISCDSAGTIGFHVGEPPDRRATAVAAARGIDLSHQRSRRVDLDDFQRFDYILAMDRANLSDLLAMAPKDCRARIELFLAYAPEAGPAEVPDPYYGGGQGFDHVLDLVEAASGGLMAALQERHGAFSP